MSIYRDDEAYDGGPKSSTWADDLEDQAEQEREGRL